MPTSTDMTEELSRALGTLELTLPVVHTSDATTEEPARYAVSDVLGRGGIGEVVRAYDVLLQRDVALKSLQKAHPGAMAQFWHEARVTATLDHPAIMPVYDAGALDGDGPFFAMKLVQGEDLHQAVANGTAGNVRRRLERFGRVCEAVSYAHSRGWLHRDLKPDNILLGAYGEVLVADWGLAWSLQASRPGPRAGTPCYMAPEQARGEPHDQRADVYALGGTLWYLLTGELPFGDATVDAILDELRAGRGFSPASGRIDAELEAIVRHALQADPGQRYADVDAMRRDVVAWLDGEEVSVATYGPLQRLGRWAGRHRGRLLFATTVTATAGVAIGAVGLVATAAVLQSARVAWQAAEVEAAAATRAQAAEEARRVQLVEARLATAAAHRSNGRGAQAREALRAAVDAGGGPGVAIATADVFGRAADPLHVFALGAPTVDVSLEEGRLLIGRVDGGWEAYALPSGTPIEGGDFGAELLALLPDGEGLVFDAGSLKRVGGDGRVLAETVWSGQPIHGAWAHDGELLVQGYGRPVADAPVRLRQSDLAVLPLPDGLADRFVMEVFEGGVVLAGKIRLPDRSRGGELRRWADGSLLTTTATRRVAPAGSAAVVGVDGRLRRVGGGGDDWRVASRAFRGVPVDDSSVLMVSEGGDALWIDAHNGAVRASLEGWSERPSALAAADGWAVVAGSGSVAVWALPETPLGLVRQGFHRAVRVHPGGRLAAVCSNGLVEVIDLPTGRSLWARQTDGAWDLVWHRDGERLLLWADRLWVFDATSETPGIDVGIAGPVGHTDTHAVVVRDGQVEWLDDALRVVARTATPGGSYWHPFQAGPAAVFPANQQDSEVLGIVASTPGTITVLPEGGSAQHVGLGGAALADGRMAFGRQDGTVQVLRPGEAPATWDWQAAAIIAMAPYRDGLVVADFDGRVYAVDASGRPYYTTTFDGYLRDVVVAGPRVVVAGSEGLWSLDLEPPPVDDLQGRLLSAHAYRYVRPASLPSDEDRLTAAVGREQGVLAALGARDDAEARVLRAWARRVGAE